MKVSSVISAEVEFSRALVQAGPKGEVARTAGPVPAGKAKEPALPREAAAGNPDGMEKKIAEEIQRYIKENRSVVDFSVDADLQIIVTKILEQDSGKVLRQYPPEAVLEVMKQLRGQRGVLVNQKG